MILFDEGSTPSIGSQMCSVILVTYFGVALLNLHGSVRESMKVSVMCKSAEVLVSHNNNNSQQLIDCQPALNPISITRYNSIV